MDAGKYYGEDSGFCLMHNSLKQQCSEAIQKCQLLTYRYEKPNQVLKEIVDTTAIKAKGFDGIRQSSSDYMIYINMVSASIASFENDYARLYQNAGDEDLIGSQLLADRARLFNQLNESKEIQQNLKARKTNTENAVVSLGESIARITEEQIKISNRIIDGYTQAIKQINEKIEKYYQIENNTRNYFKQGEEYSTKAQNILNGISKSFKGAEYHYDENAAWRVDYLKSMDDMNVIYKDRAINYLKYRGVTEDEFKQLAKYNFASTEVYNYITLANGKENEEFIMNIIHKKYENSFKKDPSTLDSYAKTFMGKYALGVWGVMYEKGDKASKEDYEKFINAVLSDNKEMWYPDLKTGKKTRLTKKTPNQYLNYELCAARKSQEYLQILSNSTLTLMKFNEEVAKKLYVKTGDSKNFKYYQREWNKCMSAYMLYQSLYTKLDAAIKDPTLFTPRMSKITNLELRGTKERDVATVEFDYQVYDQRLGDYKNGKSEVLDYASCKDEKDDRINQWQIDNKIEEGPHETIDKLSEISQTMLIVGATEINPVLGLIVDAGCTAMSEDGITSGYIEKKGKSALGWVEGETNTTGKVKEKANEIYQNSISQHMPTVRCMNSPLGTTILKGTKKGVGSAFNLDNFIGLGKSIYNDIHFNESMSKKRKDFLTKYDSSYICCKEDGQVFDMQSLDLTTQIYKDELKNKKVQVYSKKEADQILKDLKGKKGKAYELARKLVKGERSIADYCKSDDEMNLYYEAIDILDNNCVATSGLYTHRVKDGIVDLRNKIVNEIDSDK